MVDKIVGAVGVKVRPVTDGFRREAKRQIDRALDGLDENVKIDAKVDVDDTRAKRKLADLKRDAKDLEDHFTIHADVDDNAVPNLKRIRDGIHETQRAERDLGRERDKQYLSNMRMGHADDERFAKMQKLNNELQKQRNEQKRLRDSVSEVARVLDPTRSAFADIAQNVRSAAQSSEDWGSGLKPIERQYRLIQQKVEGAERALARLGEREKAENVGKWDEKAKEVEKYRRELGELLDSNKDFADFIRRWDSLDESTRRSASGLSTVHDNIRILNQELKRGEATHFADSLRALGDDELDKRLDASADATRRLNSAMKEYNRIKSEGTSNGAVLQMLNEEMDGLRKLSKEYDHLRAETQRRATDSERQRMYDSMFGALDMRKIQNTYNKAVGGNLKAMRQVIRMEIDPEINRADLEKARHEAEELQRKFDDMKANIDLDLSDVFPVSRRIDWATRPRTVNIFAKMNIESWATVQGMLASLAGANVASNLGRQFQNIAMNLDTFALKTVGAVTALGNLANAGGTAVGSLGALVGQAAQLSGLALMSPTAIATLASSVYVLKTAWSDFFTSMDRNTKWGQEAYDNLVPGAKKVADAWLKATDGMRQGIQTDFWKNASDGVTQFVTHAIPEFRDGLQGFAGEWGNFFDGIGKAFAKIAISGDLKTMWDNLGKMMKETAKGAEPLVAAFNTLGLQGSQYLPKLGEYFHENMVKFNDWVQESAKAGKITEWIDNAIHTFGQLKEVVKQSASILTSLYEVADGAGFNGLDTIVENLTKASEVMKGAKFRQQFGDLLTGAKQGFDAAMDGAKNFGRAVGDTAENMREVLKLAGDIAGKLLTGLGGTWKNPILQSGLLKSLESVRDMVGDLGPSFGGLGTALGSLLTMAGSIAKGLAPLINTVVVGFADIAESMTDGVSAAAPLITGQLTRGLSGLSSILSPIATLIGNMLEGLAQLPGPIQGIVVSLGAMLITARSVSGVMGKLGGGLSGQIMKTSQFRTAAQDLERLNDVAKKTGGIVKTGFGATMWSGLRGGFTVIENGRSQFVKFGDAATHASERVRDMSRVIGQGGGFKRGAQAMGLLKGAAGGLLSVFGGPWGLAIAGAGMAIAAFAQKQQEAKQKTDDMTQALLSQGQAGLQSTALSQMSDALQRFNDLGVDTTGILENVYKGDSSGKAIKDMQTVMDGLKQMNRESAEVQSQGGIYMGYTPTQEQIDAANRIGIGWDKAAANAPSFLNAGKQVMETTDGAAQALKTYNTIQDAQSKSGQASTAATAAMSDAMKKLADTSQDAASRIQAVIQAEDRLNGGKMSLDDATQSYNDASRALDELANSTDKADRKVRVLGDGTIDTSGKFGEMGSKFRDASKTIVADADTVATALADSGASQAEIQSSLDSAMNTFIAQAKLFGVGADDARAAWERLQGGASNKELSFRLSLESSDFITNILDAEKRTKAMGNVETIVHIMGDDTELASKLLNATNDVDAFNNIIAKAGIDVNTEEGKAKLADIREQIMDVANSSPEIIVGMDTSIFGKKASEVDQTLIAWMQANPDIALRMDDSEFKNNSKAVKEALAQLRKEHPEIKIDATDNASDKAKTAKSNFDKLPKDVQTNLIGHDKGSDAAKKAKANYDKLPKDVQTAIKGFDHGSKPAGDAKRAYDRLPKSVQSAIRAVVSGKGDVDGLRSAVAKVHGKTISIWANVGGALSQIAAVGRAAAAVHGANGGLFGDISVPKGMGLAPGFGRAFANGGISFETPGTAKIYSPASVFRVFAEPETQGEAYIPLAASKRSRSLEIWKETGKRLNAYKDGGIDGASAVKAGPTFNVTNHYPQAEPTSVTIAKAGQYAGKPAFLND